MTGVTKSPYEVADVAAGEDRYTNFISIDLFGFVHIPHRFDNKCLQIGDG